MKHKEQLLYLFLSNTKIKMSVFDKKFFKNLTQMIQKHETVTTGQADLFDMLVVKYTKQLNKHCLSELENVNLNELVWKTNLATTSNEYKSAKVSLAADSNQFIYLTVPFNKKFITDMNKLSENWFVWNKESKHYVAPFDTYSLKMVVSLLPNYFNSVIYCDRITSILEEQVNSLSHATTWNPTLKLVNGRWYVAAITEQLAELISDFDFSDDISALTVSRLSSLGIEFDDAQFVNSKKLSLAANKFSSVDVNELPIIIEYLSEIGANVFTSDMLHNINHSELISEFTANNINFTKFSDVTRNLPPGQTYNIDTTKYNVLVDSVSKKTHFPKLEIYSSICNVFDKIIQVLQ